MPARYAEHPLHPALAAHVEAAWSLTLDSGDGPAEHRVMPDGCIDIVVVPGRGPAVAGPSTRPFLSPMLPGATVYGLRFRPGAAPYVLGAAANELRDLEVPLEDVVGAGVDEPPTLVALQRLVAARLRPTDPLVDAAVRELTRAPGTDVRALARTVALSERQLRRRFHEAVGYGPKRLARVLRLQRVLAEARRDPAARGVQLAFAAGYADEAHLARDARELAGVSTQALLRERVRFVQASAPAAGDAGGMLIGLRTTIYPAADLDAAKAWFTEVLGAPPYFDEPSYVGFDVGGYELGLIPSGDDSAGPITYWGVADAKKAHAALIAKGATAHGPVQEVGEGIKVGSVRAPNGAVLGVIENPHFNARG